MPFTPEPTMKNFILATAVAAAGAATAAPIEWTPGPSFGGPNGHQGILTNGTLVQAIDLGGTGAPIVVDPTGLNLTFTRVDSPFFSTPFADSGFGTPNNIGDAGWSAVIDTAEYSSFNVSAPTFLSGLTVGATYQVQFFSGRSYPGLASRLLKYGDGLGGFSPEVSMGQNVFTSMVGTFVADAATQHIVFVENVNLPTLNAYVLREVAAPIPEPGTWALMLAGLLATGSLVRRQRA
jgi:PEP-CTERM motif